MSESRLLDTKLLNDTTTSVQCVATMRGLVAESGFVRIKLIGKIDSVSKFHKPIRSVNIKT